MRPTIGEQLAGVSRILAEVVTPALVDPYPADIIGGLIATLDAIAAAWADVPAYLAWDANRTLALLAAAAADLQDAHREALDVLTRDRMVDVPDIRSLEEHHRAARALLADVVAGGIPPAIDAAVRAHLRDRADRYPLVVAQRMPGQR